MATKKPTKKTAKATKAAKAKPRAAAAAKAANAKPRAAAAAKAANAKSPAAKVAKSVVRKPAAAGKAATSTSTSASPVGRPNAPAKPGAATTLVAPPTADQSRFLADIIATPDDKKARIVYADMLQETGDPRGDFIVLQCTRVELADTDKRVPEMQKSIDELLKKHKKAWTSFGENKGARWEYRRGFVEKLSLDAKDLLVNGPAIFAAEPIEELNVWKIDESKTKTGKSRLAPILDLPLHCVRRLSLARCKLTKEDFDALAAAKTLGSVEFLDLTNGGSYESPFGPLGKAASMPKLRELKLTGCMGGAKQFEGLAKGPLRFSRLQAQRNDVDADAAVAIANASWAPTLEHLDLSSNEMLGDDGLEAIATSKHLTSLKSIVLDYSGIYERAADIILASPVFDRLEWFDLGITAADTDKIATKFAGRMQRPTS